MATSAPAAKHRLPSYRSRERLSIARRRGRLHLRTPPGDARNRRPTLRRIAAVLAASAALALAFAALWIVVPAPSLALLPIGVVAPEWSPYFAFAGAVLAIVGATAIRGRAGFVTAGLAGLAIALSTPALVAYPALVTEANDQLARLPGDAGWSVSAYDPLASPGRNAVRIDDDLAVPLRDGTTKLGLDLYRPATAGAHPTVVVVYGGAWQFGDRRQCRPLAIELARAGYAVVMVDYRHAPQVRSPVPVEDVQDALALVAERHLAWGIDLDRVALLGRSAGAQIALVLASTPQPLPIAAAVGIYAPIDLVAGYAYPPQPDPTDVRAILRTYLGGPPDPSHLAAYEDASPKDRLAGLRAPTLLLVGTNDELVLPRFQRRYVAALRAARTPVVALEVPFANHAFDAVPFGRGATFERAVLLRFLHATLVARP